MESYKFIQAGDASGGARVTVDVPLGMYNGFGLVLKGTTDTGETLALSDIGRIRLERNGRQIISETWDFFASYGNLKAGYLTATLPTAGATRAYCMVPLQAPGLPNSMDVRSKEEVDIYLDFDSVLDTRFGANSVTYEIYGFMTPFVSEKYEIRIEEQDYVAGGSGIERDVLNGRNIAAVFVEDGSSILNRLTFEVDGKTAVNNIDDEALLDLTNFLNRVESSGNSLLEINLVKSGQPEEAKNTNAEITYDFSGAGTLKLTKFRIFKSPGERDRASAQAVSTRVNRARGSRPSRAIS